MANKKYSDKIREMLAESKRKNHAIKREKIAIRSECDHKTKKGNPDIRNIGNSICKCNRCGVKINFAELDKHSGSVDELAKYIKNTFGSVANLVDVLKLTGGNNGHKFNRVMTKFLIMLADVKNITKAGIVDNFKPQKKKKGGKKHKGISIAGGANIRL